MTDLAFILLLIFPFLVLIIPKEKIPNTLLLVMTLFSTLFLTMLTLGYGIWNKRLEFFAIFIALFILLLTLDKATQKKVPNTAKWILGGIWVMMNILTMCIMILLPLCNYFVDVETRPLERTKAYTLVLMNTGTFADYQVTCEIRKKIWGDVVYQTVDSGYLYDMSIYEIQSISEIDRYVILKGKNAKALTLSNDKIITPPLLLFLSRLFFVEKSSLSAARIAILRLD